MSSAVRYEDDLLIKEYFNMMTDMIVLCGTLALSLSFWIISIVGSTYYGEAFHTNTN